MEKHKLPFNPNDPGVDNGRYFGLPFTPEESWLVLLPVPWEVTTSYGGGTSNAPEAIREASLQVDLYDFHHPGGWKKGIGTLLADEKLKSLGEKLKGEAAKVIRHLEKGGNKADISVQEKLQKINAGSRHLNDYVYAETRYWLESGKYVGLVGGDHSVPLGAIKAAAERFSGLGILHIDAHADLRKAYEGFTWSHASIMYNVMQEVPEVTKLVQVGIRDLCDEEMEYAAGQQRIRLFTDYEMAAWQFGGESWKSVCDRIIAELPEKVYVSFDIDGLSPENAPSTGTPVPGGLSFHQAVYLLNAVTASGRKIVGFDLCEVSPATDNEWDANVGARLLYKLCNLTLK